MRQKQLRNALLILILAVSERPAKSMLRRYLFLQAIKATTFCMTVFTASYKTHRVNLFQHDENQQGTCGKQATPSFLQNNVTASQGVTLFLVADMRVCF